MAPSTPSDPASPVSVWLAPARPARRVGGAGAGTLSREKAVTAAVRILDVDGEAGLSMRKLAAELGVTAMSLYWYVANRDDLLEFALDAVAGDIELPDPEQGPWAEQLTALAHAWRRTMLAHPWALSCYGRYLNIGPNSLRVAECGRAIIARAPLQALDRPAALAAVFEYVYGASAVAAGWAAHARRAGLSTDAYLARLGRSLTAADAPAPGSDDGMLARSSVAGGSSRVRDADFDRGLRWLLAGMLPS